MKRKIVRAYRFLKKDSLDSVSVCIEHPFLSTRTNEFLYPEGGSAEIGIFVKPSEAVKLQFHLDDYSYKTDLAKIKALKDCLIKVERFMYEHRTEYKRLASKASKIRATKERARKKSR